MIQGEQLEYRKEYICALMTTKETAFIGLFKDALSNALVTLLNCKIIMNL